MNLSSERQGDIFPLLKLSVMTTSPNGSEKFFRPSQLYELSHYKAGKNQRQKILFKKIKCESKAQNAGIKKLKKN